MARRIVDHLSYANVAATMALVVALSTGGAVAANLITGADVKNNSLTGRDVRGLTGADIKDGSISPADLVRALPRIVARSGPTGIGDCFEDCEGVYKMPAQAGCNEGEVALGGGIEVGEHLEDAAITASAPIQGADKRGQLPVGWRGAARFRIDSSPAAIPFPHAWVVCAQR